MINLHECMGPGRDRTRDPWICSQTRICSHCATRPGTTIRCKGSFSQFLFRNYVQTTRYDVNNELWHTPKAISFKYTKRFTNMESLKWPQYVLQFDYVRTKKKVWYTRLSIGPCIHRIGPNHRIGPEIGYLALF